ncbi:MAG: hypothetical protein EBE86_023835 [Hormoscilla sp. GUM202]|nr:hypothetical protein [Hormoscilla sp. GUM202]
MGVGSRDRSLTAWRSRTGCRRGYWREAIDRPRAVPLVQGPVNWAIASGASHISGSKANMRCGELSWY